MMMAMIICKPPHLKNGPQIDRGSDLKGIVKDLAWNLRPGEVKEMMLNVLTDDDYGVVDKNEKKLRPTCRNQE